MCHPGDNLMIHVAVARAQAGAVIVVQAQDASYGVWGEVLTVAAMARGIAGLVVDGSVRDLGAIRRLGFPVFAAEPLFGVRTSPPTAPSARSSHPEALLSRWPT